MVVSVEEHVASGEGKETGANILASSEPNSATVFSAQSTNLMTMEEEAKYLAHDHQTTPKPDRTRE